MELQTYEVRCTGEDKVEAGKKILRPEQAKKY
jgi:hypothetical protein